MSSWQIRSTSRRWSGRTVDQWRWGHRHNRETRRPLARLVITIQSCVTMTKRHYKHQMLLVFQSQRSKDPAFCTTREIADGEGIVIFDHSQLQEIFTKDKNLCTFSSDWCWWRHQASGSRWESATKSNCDKFSLSASHVFIAAASFTHMHSKPTAISFVSRLLI